MVKQTNDQDFLLVAIAILKLLILKNYTPVKMFYH